MRNKIRDMQMTLELTERFNATIAHWEEQQRSGNNGFENYDPLTPSNISVAFALAIKTAVEEGRVKVEDVLRDLHSQLGQDDVKKGLSP